MKAAAARPRKAANAKRLVGEIARRHFGEPARRIVERDGGLTNSVYQFRVSQGDFIVRTHADATKINDYFKEQWAMDAARAAGVPVPGVLEVGNFPDGRAYMISQQIPGIDGRRAPDRLGVVEALGRAAARLHTVRTRGYGPVFEWSHNRLSQYPNWAAYLAEGFGIEARIELLLQHRMLDAKQAATLRAHAATMARWKRPTVLHHGDLRLKNTIVDPVDSRLLAVIDWETCASSPGPYWDLSLALHDLGADGKEAFLAGYGMKPREYEASLPFLRLFNMLNYACAVRSAAHRKDKLRLEWLRLRLKGGLDLYER